MKTIIFFLIKIKTLMQKLKKSLLDAYFLLEMDLNKILQNKFTKYYLKTKMK